MRLNEIRKDFCKEIDEIIKNKKYLFVFSVLVAFGILSYVLSLFISADNRYFSDTCLWIFVSILMLFAVKNAYRPNKYGTNPTKAFHLKLGKQKQYRNRCIVELILCVILAVGSFAFGMIEALK